MVSMNVGKLKRLFAIALSDLLILIFLLFLTERFPCGGVVHDTPAITRRLAHRG